jgi:hypothetical protein
MARRRRSIPELMEEKVTESDTFPLRMILLVGLNTIAATKMMYWILRYQHLRGSWALGGGSYGRGSGFLAMRGRPLMIATTPTMTPFTTILQVSVPSSTPLTSFVTVIPAIAV